MRAKLKFKMHEPTPEKWDKYKSLMQGIDKIANANHINVESRTFNDETFEHNEVVIGDHFMDYIATANKVTRYLYRNGIVVPMTSSQIDYCNDIVEMFMKARGSLDNCKKLLHPPP